MSLFQHDAAGNPVVPEVYLCRRNREALGRLFVTGLTVTENLNRPGSVSFQVPRFYQGQENPWYDQLETLQLAYLPPHGYFSLTVETRSEGNEVKEVTGTSWESELDSRYLDSFQVNTFEKGDETDSQGNYVRSRLFDPEDPDHSILHRALSGTGWQIQMGGTGEAYTTLCGRTPTYDLSRQSVRGFLSDLQEEFDLLFRFGKEERTVTCYLLSEYGQDTGIYASFENLNQKLEIQVEEDSLVTALRVTGGEGIYTEDVIPAPSGLLICLDYYLDPRFMSPDTIAAWESYQETYQEASDAYGEKLLLWEEKNTLLSEYRHSAPQAQTREEDGTLQELNQLNAQQLAAAFTWTVYPASTPAQDRFNYGLAYLQAIHDAYTEAQAVRVEAGQAQGEAYQQILRVLDASRTALDTRQQQIQLAEADLEQLNQEKAAIRQSCDLLSCIRSYFSGLGYTDTGLAAKAQSTYQELLSFLREDEYANDHYFATDLDSYADRMAITRELIALAQRELEKSSHPRVTWSCTVSNPALRREFDYARETLDVGNFMTLELHPGYAEKIRIVGAEIPYGQLDQLKLTFADRVERDAVLEDIGKQLGSSVGTAASLKAFLSQRDSFDASHRFVREMMDHGLLAAQTGIYNNDSQEISIDRHGIWGRARKTAGDFEPEQVLIQKNQILFTDDYWQTVRSALGKIQVKQPDGTVSYRYGLIADTVLVDDLYSLDASIGGWVIEEDALRTENFSISQQDGENRVVSGTYLGADGSLLTPNLQLVPQSGLTIDVNSFHLTAGGGADSAVSLDDYLEELKQDTLEGAAEQAETLLAQLATYELASSASSVIRYPDGCRPAAVTFSASRVSPSGRTAYLGNLVIQGYNGSGWTVLFDSASGEGEDSLLSSKDWDLFELNGSPLLLLRCELYAPADTDHEHLLAYQLVSVVNDSSLATDGIFLPICSHLGCSGTVSCEKSENAHVVFTLYGATEEGESIGQEGPIQIQAFDSPEAQTPAATYSFSLPVPLASSGTGADTVRDLLQRRDGRWGILRQAAFPDTGGSFLAFSQEEQLRWNQILSYPGYTRYQVSYPQGSAALQPVFDCDFYSEISFQNTLLADTAEATRQQLDANITQTQQLMEILQENVLLAGKAGDLLQSLELKKTELLAGQMDLEEAETASRAQDPYPYSYPYPPEDSSLSLTYGYCYQDSLERVLGEDGAAAQLEAQCQTLLDFYQANPSYSTLAAEYQEAQNLYDSFLQALQDYQTVAGRFSLHLQNARSQELDDKIEKLSAGIQVEPDHVELYLSQTGAASALTLAPGVLAFSSGRIWEEEEPLTETSLRQLLTGQAVSAYVSGSGLSAGQAYLENSLTLGSFQLQSRTDSQGVRHLTLFSQESSS